MLNEVFVCAWYTDFNDIVAPTDQWIFWMQIGSDFKSDKVQKQHQNGFDAGALGPPVPSHLKFSLNSKILYLHFDAMFVENFSILDHLIIFSL